MANFKFLSFMQNKLETVKTSKGGGGSYRTTIEKSIYFTLCHKFTNSSELATFNKITCTFIIGVCRQVQFLPPPSRSKCIEILR